MASGQAEIVACVTCGREPASDGGPRGAQLFERLREEAARRGGTSVQVTDVRCLWACQKSCAVMLRSEGRCGYVLVELEPSEDSARALLDYAQLYPKRETVGRETFAGEPCVAVAVTTSGGIEMKNYFSVATGRFVGSSGHLPTPMGKVFVETEITGYKEYGGRLFPTETRQKVMGTEQVLTLTDPDFSEIDPSVYALPEAIKTLVSAQPAG